jgi:hypothetical protein
MFPFLFLFRIQFLQASSSFKCMAKSLTCHFGPKRTGTWRWHATMMLAMVGTSQSVQAQTWNSEYSLTGAMVGAMKAGWPSGSCRNAISLGRRKRFVSRQNAEDSVRQSCVPLKGKRGCVSEGSHFPGPLALHDRFQSLA